jgi:hypothetical protein
METDRQILANRRNGALSRTIELVNLAHALAYELERTKPRKRGEETCPHGKAGSADLRGFRISVVQEIEKCREFISRCVAARGRRTFAIDPAS